MADPHRVDARLRLAREVLSPSDEHRLRVRSALAARLAAEGPASEGPAAEGPAAPLARAARARRLIASRRIARALEAAVLVATGFALGLWFSEARQPGADAPMADGVPTDRGQMNGAAPAPAEAAPARAEPAHEPASPSPLQGEPAVAPAAPSSTSSDVSNEPSRPETSPSPRARTHVRLAPRATATDGFAEELALLRRAERATRSGDAALARSLIGELDARFPKTALRQERAALLVLVACATGEPAAQAHARSFTEQNAQSVYLERIRAVCDLPGGSSTPK